MSDDASLKDIEAAGIYGSPSLLQYLEGWDTPDFLHEWATIRCSADPKVRDSVDDERLGDEWYLNVKHGVRRPLKFKEGDHL